MTKHNTERGLRDLIWYAHIPKPKCYPVLSRSGAQPIQIHSHAWRLPTALLQSWQGKNLGPLGSKTIDTVQKLAEFFALLYKGEQPR